MIRTVVVEPQMAKLMKKSDTTTVTMDANWALEPEEIERGYVLTCQSRPTGDPLPKCQFRVEPAFGGDGPAHTCLNPSFFDIGDPAEFDLRSGLRLAS